MASKNQKKYLDKNPNLIRHYGLRKLSVGVASVVLGTTAVLGAAQTAKADTTDNGQGPAEASQTASSTPDPASDGNQGNSYNNNTNSFVPNTLPQGESESDYVSQYADQMTQQSQPAANNENANNQTQAAPANSQSDQSEQTQNFQINNNEQSQLQNQQEANTLRTSLASDPDSGSGNNSGSQNQGQEISNSDYQILSHNVIPYEGATSKDFGGVKADISLKLNNTANIKAGDYIDIHLGLKMSDGIENYAFGVNSTIPISINGVQVGQIVPETGSGAETYYRLIFNDQIANYNNPIINLDLRWNSLSREDPETLQLWTLGDTTSYTPTNDLTIGDQAFTSGLVLKVHKLNPGTNSDSLAVQSRGLAVHNWSNGQIQIFPVDTKLAVFLPSHMSHQVTITVATPVDDSLVHTVWASDADIANKIQSLIVTNNYSGNRLQADPSLLTYPKPTSAPTVTVTSENPTRISNSYGTTYNQKIYHISISGNEPLIFSNADYISFADVISNDGVDTSNPATITNYNQDSDSSNHNFNNAQYHPTHPAISPWTESNGDYDENMVGWGGPDLANSTLTNFLNTHAMWVKVHDDQNNTDLSYTNNSNEKLSMFGAGFIASVTNNSYPTDSDQNQSSGTADVAATIKYIDDTNHQTIFSDNAEGKIGAPIQFHNDVATEIAFFNAHGYTLVSNSFGSGQTFKASGNNFEVHFKENSQTNPTNVRATIKYIDDRTGQTIMSDSVSGQVGSPITFNNDVAAEISNFEKAGYTLISNDFKSGQTFSANAADNNFEVHLKSKAPTTPTDVRATIKYIDDTNHQTLMTDSASGQVGSSINFNNDVATMIRNYENNGYKLVSNNFQTGQRFSADASANNFEVHFTKTKEPAADKYNLSIVYKLANGTIIQTVPNILTGNYPDTIPADQINNLINTHLPKGYKYVSGRLTQPEAITNADPSVNVIVAPEEANKFSQDIIYQTNDGTIIKTVPNAFTGTLTNGQATVSATTINNAIDNDMPSGYDYISGKVPADEVVQNQTPKAITVIVKKQQTNPQSQTFSQNIVYETASGMLVKTVPNAITGTLTNGQAVASASSVNSQIDANMPSGYTYVSGKLTSDELVTSATPAYITVIIQATNNNNNGNNGNNTGGNGNGNNGNNTGGNGNGNNGNNTGGNGSNPNNNGGNGNNTIPINPFIPTNNGGNGNNGGYNIGGNGFNGYSRTGYNGYYNGGYARRGYGYSGYSQAMPTSFSRGSRSSAAGLNAQQAGFRTRLPQTGTNDNSELMAMALGLGALLLSGGLAGADKHRYNN